MHVEEDLRPIIASKIAVLQTARNTIADAMPVHYILIALDEIIHNEIETLNSIHHPDEA